MALDQGNVEPLTFLETTSSELASTFQTYNKCIQTISYTSMQIVHQHSFSDPYLAVWFDFRVRVANMVSLMCALAEVFKRVSATLVLNNQGAEVSEVRQKKISSLHSKS